MGFRRCVSVYEKVIEIVEKFISTETVITYAV